ncbi:glycosyltransferase [Agromyces italicus]|uniref:glycosyltransferase n=1 Tax=Agromyces italicus TaxID=279572 RepID=UPI0003B41CF1|nr:nucleotide disphospho-sugar-binding domain-containing protein [Agromyces italicus]
MRVTLLERGTPPPGFGFAPARSTLGRLRDRLLIAALRVLTRRLQRTHESERALAGSRPTGASSTRPATPPPSSAPAASPNSTCRAPTPGEGSTGRVDRGSAGCLDGAPRTAAPEWWPELIAHCGILAALSAGVPLIVAGGDADKPEAAARLARSGAGVDLRTGRPSPRAVLRAHCKVAHDRAHTANAERLARLLDAHDGPGEVVALTTELMTKAAAPA